MLHENSSLVIGRVGKNGVTVRKTKSGTPVGNFSMAVTSKKGNVEWVQCRMWGGLTKVGQYMKQGREIAIEGKYSAELVNGEAVLVLTVNRVYLNAEDAVKDEVVLY